MDIIEKSTDYDSVTAKAITWQLNAEVNRLKNIPTAELPNEQLLEQADALIRQAIAELEKYGVKFYE